MGVFAHIELHASGVQVGHIVFGRRASLNKMKGRPLVHDDQRVLKLARARCVEPEIGLQRNFHAHMGRHIHKGAA